MKQAVQLDEVDRRLLRALQEDATLSTAALAERVGASATSCWRRIKALEDVGVLKRSVRLVDPDGVGRGVSVMLQVRMKAHSLEKHRDFERFVRDRAEVMECYSMSGEWDYLLRIVVADVAAYQRFLMEELLTFPDVATSASHFALSQVKYTTAVPV
jgi:Lrp/AsnC family transcriptional regulator